MRAFTSWFLVSVFSTVVGRCSSLTPAEMSNLYNTIFTDYDIRLLPVTNQSGPATIGTMFNIFSINGFDEISGVITMSILLSLYWKEERISWNPADYGGKSSILLRPTDLWHPQVYLYEAADKSDEVTNTSIHVRLHNDGSAMWWVGKVVSSTCSVDVTYFPFDEQYCDLTFGSNSYTQDELKYMALGSSVSAISFSHNSEWDLLDSSVVKNGTYGPVTTVVQVTLHLKRRVTFYVVYIIIPTLFLSILNILVFVMPVTSGERLSVATTMFLSFVVYMDIVNKNVPESSEPMSFFYFYLLFLVVYSSCIMFLCVISLRIHNKTSEVPPKLRFIIRCLSVFESSTPRTDPKVHPIGQTFIRRDSLREDVADYVKDTAEKKIGTAWEDDEEKKDSYKCDASMGWDAVGKVFDLYCFVFLGIGNVIMSTISLDTMINRR